MESFMEYLPTIGALIAGVVAHIIKKAATMRQANAEFSLKDYLLGHPYQTMSLAGASAGAYFALLGTGSLTVSAAFLAGIAVNSFSDAAPGDR